jgi:small acid-soluble spore protein O (minor)
MHILKDREVDQMARKRRDESISDKQRVQKHLSREFDHELANEPLTETERLNNKKTKKRQ